MIAESVAPRNRFLGLMLPYTPVLHLILDSSFKTLVMTSANITEEPLTMGNDEALERLRGDFLAVEVVSGGATTPLATYSNLDRGTAGVYRQRTLSLAAFKEKAVTLRFRATTDKTRATSFLVDDVSVR